MMTDKYKCSQIQAIIQSFDKVVCLSYLHCGVLQIDTLVIYVGLKRKNQRERERGNLMLEILLRLMSK